MNQSGMRETFYDKLTMSIVRREPIYNYSVVAEGISL